MPNDIRTNPTAITQRPRMDVSSNDATPTKPTSGTSATSLSNSDQSTFVIGGNNTNTTLRNNPSPNMPQLGDGTSTSSIYETKTGDADANKTVKVDINLAQAYRAKNPELDAWRQAVMNAGYGDAMNYVEASRNVGKDFNWVKQGTTTDFPDTLAAYKAANGGREPTTTSYELHTKDLEDGRKAMALGYDSLTEYQRYGLSDDKAARLTADMQSRLLSTTSTNTVFLPGTSDERLSKTGARLANFTAVVRRQQGGETGLESWIGNEEKALRGLGTGSPMNKDINAYVSRVMSGEKAQTPTVASKDQPGAGACYGVNVTVGPFTGGVSQCTNDKVYATVGVTTAISLSADQQTTAVIPNDGKTLDDVYSGESSGVNVSSAKLGGSGSVMNNNNGTTVSGGPSVGLGLPAGITKTTTVQIGTYTARPDLRKQEDIPMSTSRRMQVGKLGVPQ